MAGGRFATPLEGAGARASTKEPGNSLGDLVSPKVLGYERCAQVEAKGGRGYMRLPPGPEIEDCSCNKETSDYGQGV